jgi:hypothetical protein
MMMKWKRGRFVHPTNALDHFPPGAQGNAHSALTKPSGRSLSIAPILVSKDKSENRADAVAPNISAVIMPPGVATVKGVIVILSASFHLVAVIAASEVTSSVIVPVNVRRLIVTVPTASLRGSRQSHRSHQHQSH